MNYISIKNKHLVSTITELQSSVGAANSIWGRLWMLKEENTEQNLKNNAWGMTEDGQSQLREQARANILELGFGSKASRATY